MTAGRMTNSDSSMAMPIATMDSPAESGWFLRVTKTMTTNASSGRSRMVMAVLTTRLPLHQVELVYLDGAALTVNGDDDRKSNSSLSSGLGDDENGEHLASECLVGGEIPREGDHQQVHAVEHQLNAEQDADGIAAREHAIHSRGEQNAAQYQEVAQPRDEKLHAQSSRAMTIAPMRATVSRMD